jgi:hypothetical protein
MLHDFLKTTYEKKLSSIMLTMMVIIQRAILVTNVKIDPSLFGRNLAQFFKNQITT